MAKYLVTGGAGFIGSNIAEELLNRGEDVRVFDNFSTGNRKNIERLRRNPDKFEMMEGDLRLASDVAKAVEGVEFVIHQGALPSVPRSIADPVNAHETNITGTLNILQSARKFGVKRVVYASSSSVYGNSEQLPKFEKMPVNPLSPYALTKYAAEKYCQIFYEIYGLETVSLRYFNVFGPYQDPTSEYSAVIPKFINSIVNNKSPLIHGDGLQSRDFTYIENNVQANILAATKSGIAGEVFNIAIGERYTLLDLVREINVILGKNIEPVFSSSRPGDVKHSMADISKAISLMGYKPTCNFKYGLEKTIDFFVKRG